MNILSRINLSILLALACQCAAAAPACLPAKPADVRFGVTFKPDGSAAGAWAYWWCSATVYEWRAMASPSFDAATLAKLRAYMLGTNPSLPSAPTTLPQDAPSLALMRAAVIAAAAADADKPSAH